MSLFMGIVGDGRGWLVGKILRSDGCSDVAWWESKGIVLDRRNGGEKRERRGFFFSFSFFGEVVGCGSDGMMIFR